jgi:cation diffusion facilitator family transporter
MSCDCHCTDKVEIQHRTLILLLAINATMFCLEVVAGILANSTALLADSLDMLADAAVFGVALYAVGKPHSAKRRAAFVSGIVQGLLGLMVVAEVIRHFLHGSEPASLIMIMIGVVALAANVSCLWFLRKQRRGEVHIRASWIFTRTDALANLGTILGGGLVLATRSALPDLIAGAAISVIVLKGSFEIIRDAASENPVQVGPGKSRTCGSTLPTEIQAAGRSGVTNQDDEE